VATQWAQANQNAVLAGGLRPSWTSYLTPDDTDLSAAPSASNDGIQVQDALICHLHVACRETPGVRTAYIDIATLDATATYTVTLAGTSYAYDASSGDGLEATVLAGLQAILDAGTGVSAEVVAADEVVDTGRSLNGPSVRVTWAGGSITTSATGTGVLAVLADAEGAEVQLFCKQSAYSGTTAPVPWVRWGEPFAVPREGLSRPLKVGGLSRLYARVRHLGDAGDDATVTPAALVSLGPALISES